MKFLLLPFCFFIIACAAKLPVQESTEVRTRLDLAEQRMMLGTPRWALKELQAIESAATLCPRYHYDMGMAWLALNDTAKARQHLELAVKIKSDYGEAWNNLGLVHQLCRQPHEAEHAFCQALALPNYATPELATCNLARLYQQQGKYKKALTCLQQAIQKAPDNTAIALLLGKNLGDMKRKKEACAWLNFVLQHGSPKEVEQTKKYIEQLEHK